MPLLFMPTAVPLLIVQVSVALASVQIIVFRTPVIGAAKLKTCAPAAEVAATVEIPEAGRSAVVTPATTD